MTAPLETSAVGPPKKQRRRWPLYLALAIVLVPALLLALGLLGVRLWATDERLRVELEARLSSLLGTEVRIEALDLHLTSGIRLDGLRIGPPSGFSRDLLRVKQLELRYDLGGLLHRAVTLEQLSLVEPELVLETVGGQTNVAAISARFASAPGPEAPPEPIDRSGPLSPVDLVIRGVALKGLKLALAGEGPQLELSSLDVSLAGAVDRQRIDAHARLAILPEQARGPNLKLLIPSAAGALPETAEARLSLVVGATVAAAAAEGLSVERAVLDVDLRVRDGRASRLATPPLDLGLSTRIAMDPSRDTGAAWQLRLGMGDAPLVDAQLSVEDLASLLTDALGAEGERLTELLGLRPVRAGVVRLDVRRLGADLGTLEPYARLAAPAAQLSGSVALEGVSVGGTFSELRSLAPPVLAGSLHLRQVKVALPEALLRAGPADGVVDLAHSAERGIRVTGGLSVGPLRAGPGAIDHLHVALDARAQRLAYPRLGSSTVAVSLQAEGVSSPGLRMPRLSMWARLDGTDILVEERSPVLPKVRGLLAVDLGAAQVGSGTTAIGVAELGVELRAGLDRLLAPSQEPLELTLDARCKKISLPSAIGLHRLGLGLVAHLNDPRLGEPIDLDARLKASLARFEQGGLRLVNNSLELETRLSGLDQDVAPNAPLAKRLPKVMSLKGRLDLPAIHTEIESLGAYDSSARLRLDLSARPQDGAISIREVRLGFAELLNLTLSGQVERMFSPSPRLDLALALAPLDLAKAQLPPAIAARAPGFRGSGTLSFSARAWGTPVKDLEALLAHLDAPPLQVEAKLTADGVGVEVPSAGLSLSGLTGGFGVQVRPGRTELVADLALDGFSGEAAGQAVTANGLRVALEAGLWDQVWQINSELALAQVAPAGRPSDALKGSRFALDVVYPLFRNLEIRRCDLRLPEVGLDLTAAGRLERRRFGVLRPDLKVELGLDADRLRAQGWLKEHLGAVPVTGRARAQVELRSPEDRRVDLEGFLELDGLGYRTPELELVNARGRVPIEQRLRLPSASGLEGAAGANDRRGAAEALSELVERIDELRHVIVERSQLVVDAADVATKSPRTADYEALRPFYAAGTGPRLTIDRLSVGLSRLSALSLDVAYRNGIFQLDRFATQLWQGDIYGELAVQVANEDQLRFRLKSTLTDLNLDIPAAAALGVKAETAKGARDDYLVSGNVELRVDLGEGAIDGYLDLTKMSTAMVLKIIDALDPKGLDEPLQQTKGSLGMAVTFSDVVSTWLTGVVVVIKQNLLNLDFVWSRRVYNPLSLMFGSVVINAAKPVRRYSLSPFLENPALARLTATMREALRGRIVPATERAPSPP